VIFSFLFVLFDFVINLKGLPATVISSLTIVARRMASENVYIKKLESIETMGSATCIASDKTGTLTLNKMTVEHLWFDQHLYTPDLLKETHIDIEKSKTFRIMLRVSALCNKAFYRNGPNTSQTEHSQKEEIKAISHESERNLLYFFNKLKLLNFLYLGNHSEILISLSIWIESR
jgi:P-type E1-E2 ATPase